MREIQYMYGWCWSGKAMYGREVFVVRKQQGYSTLVTYMYSDKIVVHNSV
jgi:hypothetical protein